MAVWEVYELCAVATVFLIFSAATVLGGWGKHIILGHAKFISDSL